MIKNLKPLLLPAVISLLLAAAPSAIGAQSADAEALTPWTLVVSPSAVQPLLANDFSFGSLFATSWGGGLTAEYALGLQNLPLSLRAGLAYSYGNLAASDSTTVPGALNEVSLSVGAILEKDLNRIMVVDLFAIKRTTGKLGSCVAKCATGSDPQFATWIKQQ